LILYTELVSALTALLKPFSKNSGIRLPEDHYRQTDEGGHTDCQQSDDDRFFQFQLQNIMKRF